MDEKKKEADSVSHFSAERIFGFWGQEKATEIPLIPSSWPSLLLDNILFHVAQGTLTAALLAFPPR